MSALKELTNLMNDSLSNRVALFASDEGVSKYTDQAIREAFFEIIGDDKLTWQGWRNHKNEIFTVIENVLTTNLPKCMENSPFYNQFVETKNGALGDKNEYVIDQDGILVASRFLETTGIRNVRNYRVKDLSLYLQSGFMYVYMTILRSS